MTPLSRAAVLRMHRILIDLFGGSHGIRDEGLLDSALAQPMATFAGELLHGERVGVAAAYAFHLVRNHPFIDGNKRIAATAMGAFLDHNGVDIHADEAELYRAILAVADGSWDKATLTTWLHTVTTPRDATG